MATAVPAFRTSLLPIFIARLRTLVAIAPALRELPGPYLNELQSLLERTEKLVEKSVEGSISFQSESPTER
jgi:hypothetical protein